MHNGYQSFLNTYSEDFIQAALNHSLARIQIVGFVMRMICYQLFLEKKL